LNDRIATLGARALAGESLGRAGLLDLAAAGGGDPADLLHWAHRVRTRRFGNAVRLCAIVAGKTGACSEDCRWCAQSAGFQTHCEPARATCEQIAQAAEEAARWGACHLGIVNSGRTPTDRDIDTVTQAAVAVVGKKGTGTFSKQREKEPVPFFPSCCASLGELTEPQAKRLADAGITRYNHNLETSRRMYAQMVTTHTYDDRLRTLSVARAAGMGICCGGIFGLGETWEDRVDMALTLRDEVRPDVVPLNFLHPIPGTPLADVAPLTPTEILTIIAVYRLAMPDVDIKVAGGREHNLGDQQPRIFEAGATSILIGNYLTTTGRAPEDDLEMIDDLELQVVAELPSRRK